MSELVARLQKVRRRIDAAAERAGRSPDAITLVAVTKTVPCEEIARALAAGVEHIGENRVQEAERKFDVLGPQVHWHLVGHLQSNKVKRALRLFDWIHSVDSVKLLRLLDQAAKEADFTPHVLLQVNTSGEESKFGVSPSDLKELVECAGECETVRVEGLMTIGPLTDDKDAIRGAFRRLRELAQETQEAAYPGIGMRHLSMGMTNDFEIAIEEGATILRIGSAIFGPRRKP